MVSDTGLCLLKNVREKNSPKTCQCVPTTGVPVLPAGHRIGDAIYQVKLKLLLDSELWVRNAVNRPTCVYAQIVIDDSHVSSFFGFRQVYGVVLSCLRVHYCYYAE